MHNVPGYEWDTWNRKMRKLLIDTQDKKGCAEGSWDPVLPAKDAWGDAGGRIMMTSLVGADARKSTTAICRSISWMGRRKARSNRRPVAGHWILSRPLNGPSIWSAAVEIHPSAPLGRQRVASAGGRRKVSPVSLPATSRGTRGGQLRNSYRVSSLTELNRIPTTLSCADVRNSTSRAFATFGRRAWPGTDKAAANSYEHIALVFIGLLRGRDLFGGRFGRRQRRGGRLPVQKLGEQGYGEVTCDYLEYLKAHHSVPEDVQKNWNLTQARGAAVHQRSLQP